jgi:heme/copper-type cytochrome/quinol oxidase subunit 2
MILAILWVCAAISVAVFAVMLYSVATFNSVPEQVVRRRVHKVALELFWSLIPILIFLSAILPVVKSMALLG